MRRFILAITLACCVLLLGASVASPAMAQSPDDVGRRGSILTVKTGSVRLVEGSQNLAGTDRVFDRSADSVFAIEGEGMLPGGNVSIGGEFLRYENSFRRASAPGGQFEDDLYTAAFLIKSKYYFRAGKAWQPYFGLGVGVVWADDLTGPVHGRANGLGYQGVIGMQLRSDRIGVRLEYMALGGRPSDKDDRKVDVSSRGVFVGVSFFFGRR